MNKQDFSEVFPLGSHLCREPMPAMPELKRDMKLLKGQGFNLVKIQEHWMIDEPREGEYDFSRSEELIDHAARLDMGVYLGLTCEQAPHWLYDKYPDCRMIRRDGLAVLYEAPTTLPADGKPGPCYDHPGAMQEQLRYIARLVTVLARFENVVVWNTWQEVNYWAEALIGDSVCFCPHTLKAFHHWLEQRYCDIDALNSVWNARYPDWPSVLPSRSGGAKQPQAVDLHWGYFMDNVQVANVLRARADAIRRADPLDRAVFAHKGGPAFGSGQDWTYAESQDFLGTSCYPSWFCGHYWDDGHERPFRRGYTLLNEMLDGVAYRFDYIRSANAGQGHAGGAPIWAAEFQGGPVSTGFHKGRVPSAEDMRRWMLSALASGVTAISFWVSRAEIMSAEHNGFSLLDSVGDSTERFEEAGRIGRALQKHADLFAYPTLQPAEVGVLVDESNHQLCRHLGTAGENLAYATRGWHRFLLEMNVPMDFVNIGSDIESLSSYTVLVHPLPLSMSDSTAQKLVTYVERGGRLISEAAPGRIDENGVCRRGEMSSDLADLFCVRQRGFTMVREPDSGTRWSPPERSWGEYLNAQMLDGAGPLAGCRLRANIYLQTFHCLEDAEPVMKAGDDVVGVRRRCGAGEAWLFGTYIGHSALAYREPRIMAAVRAIFDACGLRAEHEDRLLVRKRIASGKEGWIFINPTGETVTEFISATGFSHAEDLLGEPVERTEKGFPISVDPFGAKGVIFYRHEYGVKP